MLRDVWSNAANTAVTYICWILFFYIAGLFFLLIHSIRQRTECITCYDVYLELCDIVNSIRAMFRTTKKEEQMELKQRTKEVKSQNQKSLHLNGFKNGHGK